MASLVARYGLDLILAKISFLNLPYNIHSKWSKTFFLGFVSTWGKFYLQSFKYFQESTREICQRKAHPLGTILGKFKYLSDPVMIFEIQSKKFLNLQIQSINPIWPSMFTFDLDPDQMAGPATDAQLSLRPTEDGSDQADQARGQLRHRREVSHSSPPSTIW